MQKQSQSRICAASVLMLLGSSYGIAQQPLLRADPSLHLIHIEVQYGDQRVAGAGAILRGEPLELQLGVVNRSGGPPAAAELDWPGRISLALRPGGRFDAAPAVSTPVKCIPIPATERRHDVEKAENYLVLGREGSDFVHCRVDLKETRLVAGRHTVTAEWTAGADLQTLPPRHPDAVRAVLEFEFREVVSEADELDLLNNLAVRAMTKGRLGEALTMTERALAIEPLSSVALILRGRVRAAQGACPQAKADWEFAARVMQNGTDTRNQRLAQDGEDNRRMLAGTWREKASRLPCP